MPNAKKRQNYDYDKWLKYLMFSTGKNLEYQEDYYKYLRGMLVIRDLESYELDYLRAYDYIVLGVR